MAGNRTSWNVGFLVALALLGCGGPEAAQPLTEAEGEAFMRGYETALRNGDREGVIALYDTSGVFMLGNGGKAFVSFDSLSAQYRTHWNGPDYFTFQDLSYVPAGDSAMVVAGQFLWFQAGMPDTMRFSYTSLVHRTPAGLRIKVEDESYAPPGP